MITGQEEQALATAIIETWLQRDRDEENCMDEYSCLYCEATGVLVWGHSPDEKHKDAVGIIDHEDCCPVLIAKKIIK